MDSHWLADPRQQRTTTASRSVISRRPEPAAEKALEILRDDFTAPDLLGPRRAALFNGDETDHVLRQDVVGFVQDLLREVDRIGST